MRRGKLLATIALLGAVIGGILVGGSPTESVLAHGHAHEDDGGGTATTTSLNRGW